MKIAYLNFEKIGQGLFYTGRLRSDRNFNFVYDCGSLSQAVYLSNAIDNTRSTMDLFDMVVISHFDEDHVNGIATLIRNKKVKLLVLPYVSWIERLMISAHYNGIDNEYLRLLRDPIAFFGNDDSFDIDRIAVVGGPDTPPSLDPDLLPPSSDEKDGNNTDDNNERIGIRIAGDGVDDEEVLADMLNIFLPNVDSVWGFRRDLVFYKTPFSIFAGNFWEFHFYNQQSSDIALQARFQKALNIWMKNTGISMRDIFDEEHRSSVRTIYKKYYRNLNQTSLVLYHGPLRSQQTIGLPYSQIHSTEKAGTLLTGDLNISSNKVLKNLLAYYRDHIIHTGIFLIPHHAAFANWHFKYPSGLEDFEIYICSAGINRKHHPSAYVLKDIRTFCSGDIFQSHEAQNYLYYILLR